MKTLNDLTFPAEVERKLLEKDVQKQCVDWARARGYWARKFSSQSQRSVPDYLFAWAKPAAAPMAPYLVKFAVEFKAPGKTSTSAQLDEQEAMRAQGWDVFECDNLEAFKKIVYAAEARAL